MQVRARTSQPTPAPEVAPTVRGPWSSRLGAVVIGIVIVAAAALGVLLRYEDGGDGSPKPNPPAASVEPADTPVIPFPFVPPGTGEGVNSVDG